MAQAIFGQIVRSSPKWIHRAYKSSHKFGYCTRNVLPGKKASLVIFDKDGTLICFGAGWTEWTHSAVKSLAHTLQKPVEKELYHLLGYNEEEKKWKEGLMCDLNHNIIEGLAQFLVTHGMSYDQAIKTAKHHCIDTIVPDVSVISPIDNPKEILESLRAFGVKTAVCTADNSAGCDYMIDKLNLHGLFDFTLCCDDKEMKPKPNPANIHLICDRLRVAPRDTIMVGDSLRDIEMGRVANVMASVGVLSGVGCANHLEKADYIIPSIKHILELVLPQGYKQTLDDVKKS